LFAWLNFSPIHSVSQRKNPSEISIPIRLEPTQTPQDDPKKFTIPIQILYRKSSQNKNQEIKPKNYTYPKKNGFSTVWVPRKCRNSKLFGLTSVGPWTTGTGAIFRPKRWIAHRTPPSSSLWFSTSLSVSLSFSLGISLISLSVGTKRKEEQERREKRQGRNEEKN
jgi:hypothetical protein